ncbi:cation efflux family-domain-containing protein [Glomus cerebriforme]|uniref:Cation efflux family-domain-containing protein n=1 Tax=Glomus cerebriforme TaxID=658196 RepID=A0A397SSL0_9GLOM|nr:cation efflux family-domain-containing protein [Glomus cerebriforme]
MESPRSKDDRTKTFQSLRPESPRLTEPVSPRIRRSDSPPLDVKYNNMYSLSHASTSSSPHLQLPRTTVLRKSSSSLSFQAISELDDDNIEFSESSYKYSDKSTYDQHDHHHSHDSEKEKHDHVIHVHSHEAHYGIRSHDHGYSHSAQLPTLSYIFSSLHPSQKTLFTWGTVHLFLGILLWLKGQWGCGLALTGFAYIVIFDAFGVFTTFISSVIATYRSLRESTIRNPFGVQRYEILFGFINTLYLLFVALYMLKEGLEHFILESSEEHVEDHSPDFPMIWVLLTLGATLISAICYRNHKGFSALLRSASSVMEPQPNYRQTNDGFSILLTNLFTLSTLLCGASVIFVGVLTEKNHSLGWLDKLVSILESALMFYLAGPVAAALGKILLQTTPDSTLRSLEACLREIQLDPTILSLSATHFWANSYGQLVGTICIQVNQDANEQAVLANVYDRLSPLFVNNDGSGELTVQIVK